jgi:hypothetical protein
MSEYAKLDPMGKFKDVDPRQLIEMVGLIQYWIDLYDDRSFKQQVEDNYGFGPLHRFSSDSTVDSDGVMKYPGDPDLYPIAVWHRDGETAYMYQYAIMAFVMADGDAFVTRVD